MNTVYLSVLWGQQLLQTVIDGLVITADDGLDSLLYKIGFVFIIYIYQTNNNLSAETSKIKKFHQDFKINLFPFEFIKITFRYIREN